MKQKSGKIRKKSRKRYFMKSEIEKAAINLINKLNYRKRCGNLFPTTSSDFLMALIYLKNCIEKDREKK